MADFFPAANNDTVDYYHTNALVRGQDEISWENPSDDAASDLGLRFTNVTIPQGATILTAKVVWVASRSSSSATVNATIRGQAADNAATFTAGGGGGVSDFTTRLAALTTASVAWNAIASQTSGSSYDSPDITSVVQEIVNRGGWTSGNAIVVFFLENSSSNGAARFTSGYAHGSNYPKLVVTYSTSTNVTVTPAVLAAIFTIPTVTVSTTSNVTVPPSSLSASFSLPAPIVSGDAIVSPAPLTATFSLPEPNILIADTTVFPNPLTATLSLPAPTIQTDQNLSVSPLSATFSLPTPTITASQNVSITPSPLSAYFSLLTPSRIGGLWTNEARASTAWDNEPRRSTSWTNEPRPEI